MKGWRFLLDSTKSKNHCPALRHFGALRNENGFWFFHTTTKTGECALAVAHSPVYFVLKAVSLQIVQHYQHTSPHSRSLGTHKLVGFLLHD